MIYNLNVPVKSPTGENYKNGDKEDTLWNIAKVVISQPMQDDPANLEFQKKVRGIYGKLDDSENGEVDFKVSSMEFILERMFKAKVPYTVSLAFGKLFQEPLTQAQLDDV